MIAPFMKLDFLDQIKHFFFKKVKLRQDWRWFGGVKTIRLLLLPIGWIQNMECPPSNPCHEASYLFDKGN